MRDRKGTQEEEDCEKRRRQSGDKQGTKDEGIRSQLEKWKVKKKRDKR